MVERIKQLIVSEGMTSASFADAIGVQRSSMSHILNGRNNPSLDFVTKTLQRFPAVNASWLLLGEGSMYSNGEKPSVQPVKELSIFNSVPEPIPVRTEKIESKAPDIQPPTSQKPSKYVTQVLVFYSDHTYDEFVKPGDTLE